MYFQLKVFRNTTAVLSFMYVHTGSSIEKASELLIGNETGYHSFCFSCSQLFIDLNCRNITDLKICLILKKNMSWHNNIVTTLSYILNFPILYAKLFDSLMEGFKLYSLIIKFLINFL